MNLFEAKMLAMWVLGLVSVVIGLIPVAITRKLRWNLNADEMSKCTRALFSGILCFGGGVLMATGFLHMLPEVHEGWETYVRDNNIDTNLPLGIVVICAGFFLVYFVEEVAHLIADRHVHNRIDVSIHRAVSVRGCPASLEGPSPPCDSAGVSEALCEDSTICHRERNDCEDKEYCRQISGSTNEASTSRDERSKGNDRNAACAVPVDSYGTFSKTSDEIDHDDHTHRRFENAPPPETALLNKHGGHHHHGLLTANGRCMNASMRGLLVIVALSLHEVLEGLAVGLQKNQAGVLQLFAAIASHKFIISFCVIGLELASTGVKLILHVAYILVFSLVTPLGIGIGIWITHYNDDQLELPALIMQGLACGTILYVAFFEILERERSKSTAGLVQWTLLLAGFLVIMALEALVSEPENEVIERGGHP